MPRMKFGFDTILSIDIDVYHGKYARVDEKKKHRKGTEEQEDYVM